MEDRPPVPFREFVLKIHQRCNLSCDYCYVYTMGDQTWRAKPTMMDREVWKAAAQRIAEHARTHDLDSVRIVLHGGEPLLVGTAGLLELVRGIRPVLESVCRATFVVQTNGTLLDEPMLAALIGEGVDVGVSLDGTVLHHDRHRRYADGRGSADEAQRALTLLGSPAYRHGFAGILCTVDPVADPVGCYEALVAFRPPALNFLLPHANWDSPPVRPAGTGPTPYGDWLCAVFDRWFGVARSETQVHIFVDIIRLLFGAGSQSEQVGLSPVAVAVIESDGSIEQVDSLKSAYPGACATGLDVFAHAFDEAMAHPGIRARHLGVAGLCATCQECRVRRICGGGHFAHRYRSGSGFGNPSAYCADMIRIIDHVRTRVGDDLRQRATLHAHP